MIDTFTAAAPALLLLLIPVGLVFLWIYLKFVIKLNVDWRSMLAKTIPLDRGVFGVYCFTGKQGSGKTYSLNKFIRNNVQGKTLYSNVTLKGIDYIPIESIEHLISLKDQENCFIVFDEIFTMMTKSTRFSEEIMEFLSQQRKMKNIFFTTAQEWLELPMTFRRFVRTQIECSTYPLGKLGGLLFERYYDATLMQWSQFDNEYVAPLITWKVSKYEKKIMTTYDTHERIRILKNKNDNGARPAPSFVKENVKNITTTNTLKQPIVKKINK